MIMKLSLAYSTCPNDTFIFYAIANRKIDLEGLEFDIEMHDIDVLNRNAAASGRKPDVTKISSNAYGIGIWKDYITLDAGAALGRNNGPMLVARKCFDISDMDSKRILIPGVNTTANLLFSVFFPNAKNKTPMLFSDIEGNVINGSYDCGLLIHEGRFTYKSKGLEKIVDFGEMWEQNMHKPIPLGTIIASRSLGRNVAMKVSRIIRRSIEYAFQHPQEAFPYIREHARELSDEVTQSHIKLYVNDFSVDLGPEGRDAISFLYQKAMEVGFIKELPQDIFL